MMRSKRQILRTYGFNDKTFKRLIADGVVRVQVKPGKRPTVLVDEESLLRLVEGEHYIVCCGCGARQFQMTTKHLRACSSLTLGEYRNRHPDAQLVSAYSSRNKQKTLAQREAQSEKLRQRFQGPGGEATRQQISASSKRMQENGYREVATKHLRAYGKSEEGRQVRKKITRRRWENGELRKTVEGWHRDHREQSLASIAHARRHMKKTSSIHLRLKDALVEAGVEGLHTEYPVAWYSIDEANPELKFAIEVDGCYWHSCVKCGFEGTSRVRRIDKAKTTYLERRGWTLLRIPEHEIREDLAACVESVRTRLAQFLG